MKWWKVERDEELGPEQQGCNVFVIKKLKEGSVKPESSDRERGWHLSLSTRRPTKSCGPSSFPPLLFDNLHEGQPWTAW